MHFSIYLRELRGKRSLREMERITGLSHTYLSTLEKGFDPRTGKERNPTPEVLRTLSEALNVNYVELLIKAGYLSVEDLEMWARGTNESIMRKGAD